METGKWRDPARPLPDVPSIFHFPFSSFLLPFAALLLSSCGTPGNPVPPHFTAPAAVTDLVARQQGASVALTFTLPTMTAEGESLQQTPDVEILRGFAISGAQPGKETGGVQVVYTIPAALVETYMTQGRVRFLDPLRAEELEQRAGERLLYVVRTRVSSRRASDDSNVVALRVYPPPAPVADLSATLTEAGVVLRWSPPALPAGAHPAAVSSYRIYRAEIAPEAAGRDAADAARAPGAMLVLAGVSATSEYSDANFAFGRAYLYLVRSVAQYAGDAVESADSNAVTLLARDTFAPAAPRGLVAVPALLTAEGAERAAPAVELSWDISPETDVAGYHVYRSEGPAAPARVNSDLLLVPVFRDMSVAPGRTYAYAVTAVDRAGNESARSAEVKATVPRPADDP
jgi:hypothetical protein